MKWISYNIFQNFPFFRIHRVGGTGVSFALILCFKDGDFDVDNRPREGRPKTSEEAEWEALLDEDPYYSRSTRKMGKSCR